MSNARQVVWNTKELQKRSRELAGHGGEWVIPTVYVLLALAAVLCAVAWGASLAPSSDRPTPQKDLVDEDFRLAAGDLGRESRFALFGSIGLVLLFVGLPVLSWAFGLRRTLHLVFLNRYAVLLAVIPLALIPLGRVVLPGMLGGLFALQSPAQLFNVTWLSALVGALPLLMVTVTEHNAPRRYPVRPAAAPTGWWKVLAVVLWWAAWALLSLPLPLACLQAAKHDRGLDDASKLWLYFSYGLVVGLLGLLVGHVVEKVLVPAKDRLPMFVPFGFVELLPECNHWLLAAPRFVFVEVPRRLLVFVGPGYSAGPGWKLTRGHAQMVVVLATGLTMYLIAYFWFYGQEGGPNRKSWFPAMFFLLLILSLTGVMLSGLAFWLDRFHVSPLLAALAFWVLMYSVNRTDHFFDLHNAAAAGPPPPTFRQAVHARQKALGPLNGAKRPLVCVTAAGGGIQASAWSARVLTGLSERYGPEFTKSVTLISSVSGGSVGVMFYLDGLDPDGLDPEGKGGFRHRALDAYTKDAPDSPSVQTLAMRSSLESTAWGFAYPDLMRTVFPPAPGRDDRGIRIEEDWGRRLRRAGPASDWRMDADLAGRMAGGKVPITVFNTTIAETGQRMLLWPLRSRTKTEWGSASARELVQLYPRSRLPVTTAARLSATFSYVSPICRPARGEGTRDELCYHFCDGGYVDNEGMVTLLDLLDGLYDEDTVDAKLSGRWDLPYDRILIVRIQPFPTAAEPKRADPNRGWLYTTVGPLDALQNVRVASQAERNTKSVYLFKDSVQDGQWGLEKDGTGQVGLKVVEFTYDPRRHGLDDPSANDPPLNWTLTEKQKTNIVDVWERLKAEAKTKPVDKNGVVNPLNDIDDFWSPPKREQP